MTTRQITGLGPLKADGSLDIYTIDRSPIHVSAEWLKEQSSYPTMGDEISFDSPSGPYKLIAQSASSPVIEPKKEDGLDVSGATPKPSLVLASGVKPPKPNREYVANPVNVEAFVITEVPAAKDELGAMTLTLDDGQEVVASAEMLSRYIPVVGDYWVVQADGYVYLNPKHVFERKYAPIS